MVDPLVFIQDVIVNVPAKSKIYGLKIYNVILAEFDILVVHIFRLSLWTTDTRIPDPNATSVICE